MNAKILVTGVAVAVLVAGAAAAQSTTSTGSMSSSSSAGTGATSAPAASDTGAKAHAKHHAHHKRMASNERHSRGGQYAAPAQPIPYAQLDQYMKASPKERMAMAQQANTGTSADVSATAPAATAPAASPPPTSQSNMGAAGSDNQSMAPQNSMGSPNTGGPGAMNTNPPVNGATTGSANQTPTMGQGHNGSDAPGTPAAGTPNMSGPNQPQ
ncbi:MAG: hypothetical protein JO111_10730 [Caulobacteraceae bacterium]|nr:hypothetical protein [Caulobacteraceae bacterium]